MFVQKKIPVLTLLLTFKFKQNRHFPGNRKREENSQKILLNFRFNVNLFTRSSANNSVIEFRCSLFTRKFWFLWAVYLTQFAVRISSYSLNRTSFMGASLEFSLKLESDEKLTVAIKNNSNVIQRAVHWNFLLISQLENCVQRKRCELAFFFHSLWFIIC